MKYWACYKKQFVREHLAATLTSESLEVRVLQVDGRDTRDFKGELIGVENDEITIALDATVNPEQFEFNPKLPLIVALEGESKRFRRDKYDFFSNKVTCKLPAELKVIERREVQRFGYKYQDHKSVSFTFGEKFNEEGDKLFSATLLDISVDGLAMACPEHKLTKVGQKVLLHQVTDQELPEKLLAKIVHCAPYEEQSKKNKIVRLGLSFDCGLNSISYSSIKSICKKKQRRSVGLDVSSFCGLHEDEIEREIARVEISNPIWAREITEYVEHIDKLRFLTLGMKQEFLKECNHSILGAALRISSKELVYELLNEVTDNLREEILHQMKDSRPASVIREAQEKICKIILDKEKDGSLVLDPNYFDTLV